MVIPTFEVAWEPVHPLPLDRPFAEINLRLLFNGVDFLYPIYDRHRRAHLIPVPPDLAHIDYIDSLRRHTGGMRSYLAEAAHEGMIAVEQSQLNGRSCFDLDESGNSLLFATRHEFTAVYSTADGEGVVLPSANLLAAWRLFRADVQALLDKEFPGFRLGMRARDWGTVSWPPFVDALSPKTAARRFHEHETSVIDLLDRGEAYYRDHPELLLA